MAPDGTYVPLCYAPVTIDFDVDDAGSICWTEWAVFDEERISRCRHKDGNLQAMPFTSLTVKMGIDGRIYYGDVNINGGFYA